jgi:TP901 family phage tail tape measure protein
MVPLTLNLVLRAQDNASQVVAGIFSKIRNAEQNAQKGLARGRAAGGPGLHDVSAAVTQLGGAARSALEAPIMLAANFEAAMNKLNALSGGKFALNGQLEGLETRARELGKATAFTATEVAQSFQRLTQAGFSYEQQLNTISTVLDMSTMADITLAQSAQLMADTLGQFKMDTTEAGRAGNALVRASQMSQISITELGDSFKHVAPVAADFKVSIEDTAIAVAALGKSGVKQGPAGTGLRSFINRMSAASSDKFATDPQRQAMKVLGITDERRAQIADALGRGKIDEVGTLYSQSLQDARAAGVQPSEINAANQKMLQERSSTIGKLMAGAFVMDDKGETIWSQMVGKMDDSNKTLAETAAMARKGTKNEMKVLESAMEELAITIGQKLLPVVTPLLKDASDLAVRFADWAKENGNVVVGVGKLLGGVVALSAVLGPAITLYTSFATLAALSRIALVGTGGAGGVVGAASKGTTVFKLFGGAISIVGAAFAGWALGKVIDDIFGVSDALAGVVNTQGTQGGNVMIGDMTPQEKQQIAKHTYDRDEAQSKIDSWMPYWNPEDEYAEAQAKIDKVQASASQRIKLRNLTRDAGINPGIAPVQPINPNAGPKQHAEVVVKVEAAPGTKATVTDLKHDELLALLSETGSTVP